MKGGDAAALAEWSAKESRGGGRGTESGGNEKEEEEGDGRCMSWMMVGVHWGSPGNK